MDDSNSLKELKKSVVDLLSVSNADRTQIENKINMLVYDIYSLTDEEISLVEETF